MLNLTIEELTKMKAIHTAREIHQQPETWQELFSTLKQTKDRFNDFIRAIYEKHSRVRVIFTGAGTSAFVGDTLIPALRKDSKTNVQFESIPTTDIVSNPQEYLLKDTPTILVSFARSGNSPESVAAVSLGQQIIKDFYQVVITCNKDGKLANVMKDKQSFIILTPEKTHDQGFAMTSSFTSMIMAGYLLFSEKEMSDETSAQFVEIAKSFIDYFPEHIDHILRFDFERIVYLGSGLLGQLAHEAALKMLELSSGQIVAVHESSLGFRHGPKTILNEKSLVVLFMSQDPYTRKYDVDILRELSANGTKVIVLTEKSDKKVDELAEWTIPVSTDMDISDDFNLALLYVTFAQTLALKKSIQLGITPDNPSPDGKVNRVVQGVSIHELT